MKKNCRALTAALTVCLLTATTFLNAEDAPESKGPVKTKDTVDKIRLPDPPQVSTGTPKGSAEKISKTENAKEAVRQKETAKKCPIYKAKVPLPSDK